MSLIQTIWLKTWVAPFMFQKGKFEWKYSDNFKYPVSHVLNRVFYTILQYNFVKNVFNSTYDDQNVPKRVFQIALGTIQILRNQEAG